jgi:hypothetical protein
MSDTFGTEAVPAAVETAPVVEATGTPDAGSVDAPPVVDAATSVQEPVVDAGDLHTVKINGVDHQVTLDELRNGYSRQQDYTQKTQQLKAREAELQQAAALAAAFERDPHATLSALSDAYNWTPQQTAQFAAEQQAQQQAPQVPFEELDPTEQRIARVEQFIQQQERQSIQQQIEQDYADLETQYGEIDRDAVRNHAIIKRVDLKTAYRDLQFDAERANAAAVEAKRAAQVVAPGGGVQSGAVSAPPAKDLSLRDQIRLAIQATR